MRLNQMLKLLDQTAVIKITLSPIALGYAKQEFMGIVNDIDVVTGVEATRLSFLRDYYDVVKIKVEDNLINLIVIGVD